MARLMSLIWRLDYSTSYSFMDKLGSVRRIVEETIPNYWTKVIDGNFLYSYVADYQSIESGISRNMSVEVQSLNGLLRWRTGTDLARFCKQKTFAILTG